MRIGVVASSGGRSGMGNLERQLAFAAHAREEGHVVAFVTDSEVGRARCEAAGFDVRRVDRLGGPEASNAASFLDAFGPERTVVDVPDDVVPDVAELANAREAILVLSPGRIDTVVGAVLVRIGEDLDAMTRRGAVQHGGPTVLIHSGRGFLLFRDEFAAGPGPYRERDPRSLLITHGGSDPWRLTERTLRALEGCRHRYRVTVLAGAGFEPDRDLEAAARSSKHTVRIEAGTGEVSRPMREAALAIINGGTTRYELCRTATPFVALSVNEVQHAKNLELERLGVGQALGVARTLTDADVAAGVDGLTEDAAARATMSERMASLFDMDGAARLLAVVVGAGRDTLRSDRQVPR